MVESQPSSDADCDVEGQTDEGASASPPSGTAAENPAAPRSGAASSGSPMSQTSQTTADSKSVTRHSKGGKGGSPEAEEGGKLAGKDDEKIAGGAAEDQAPSLPMENFWYRAGWLILLLICQSTSAIVLEGFQLLIRKHPVVVYYLTMLVGAGGNAGCQSAVLVIRQLAIARVRGSPDDNSVVGYVFGEICTGAKLALVIGFVCFLRLTLFHVSGLECLAICLSMFTIVFVSVILGTALPLLLDRLRVDPGHGGAAIQVVMDVTGVTLTCIICCLVLDVPIWPALVHDPALMDIGISGAVGPHIQRDGSIHRLVPAGTQLRGTLVASKLVAHPIVAQ
eukprot:gnl/TRDRNA2_/TRDRNA2_162313_c0_seq1.p1 gnl/TRDRNA2_/TRDRNA2_162313_c0~~gnl/TRDRNA2_/TRDRNA2_162313_c0_seq1.p1  ORF type:complete len:337 (+),score=43.80 gnl/TRDRNA2_/TRDRNA2_162313_c0_seq1:51-1061(+)